MNFKGIDGYIIAGHRGNPTDFPENTMDSFRSAIEVGVDMIETDIHASKDGELVLIHDHTLERTTDGSGLVCEKTFEELRSLNAGTDENPALIPTLEELLALVQPHKNLLLDLEIKVYYDEEGEERAKYTVDETVKLCDKYHMDGRVMINSFDSYVLEYVNEKYNGKFILHGYYPYDVMHDVTENTEKVLDYACIWKYGEEGKKACEYLLERGILPCTGSNTTEEIFLESIEFGHKMFTENNPKMFTELRKKGK